MINGMIRLSIGASNFVVIAIPCDKTGNPILDRGLGPEADVTQEIADIGEGFRHISGLHRQHILYRRAAQRLLQKFYYISKLFRVVIADIVNPRRRTARAPIVCRNVIDKTQYYTGDVVDMGEVAAHSAMVKELDRLALDNRPGEQKNRHIGPSPWAVNGKESQAGDRQAIKMGVGMSHHFVG